MKLKQAEWDRINKYAELPDEARPLIERTIELYSFHKNSHDNYQTRGASISELTSLTKLADRLAAGLTNIGLRSEYALIDTFENGDFKTKYEIWSDRVEIIKEISACLQSASNFTGQTERGKPGPQAFALDTLVWQLGALLHHFNGKNISRSKVFCDYIYTAVAIADPTITIPAIDGVIKRIVKANSTSPSKSG